MFSDCLDCLKNSPFKTKKNFCGFFTLQVRYTNPITTVYECYTNIISMPYQHNINATAQRKIGLLLFQHLVTLLRISPLSLSLSFSTFLLFCPLVTLSTHFKPKKLSTFSHSTQQLSLSLFLFLLSVPSSNHCKRLSTLDGTKSV